MMRVAVKRTVKGNRGFVFDVSSVKKIDEYLALARAALAEVAAEPSSPKTLVDTASLLADIDLLLDERLKRRVAGL